MLETAKSNVIPPEHWDLFESIIWENASVFHRSISSEPARPLETELTSDARPVRVKLRNYSASQRKFM